MSNEQLLGALTTRTLQTQDEVLTKQLRKDSAIDVRDSFVKVIYDRLFLWVVNRINSIINSKQGLRSDNDHYIGLLDIFGFEQLGKNRYGRFLL